MIVRFMLLKEFILVIEFILIRQTIFKSEFKKFQICKQMRYSLNLFFFLFLYVYVWTPALIVCTLLISPWFIRIFYVDS